jgi:hypothetical protein
MTPQPTDKLDTTTTVAVNGPADGTLLNERIVGHHATGPARACLSRMPGNWHVRFYVPRLVMLKLRATPRFRAARSDFIG